MTFDPSTVTAHEGNHPVLNKKITRHSLSRRPTPAARPAGVGDREDLIDSAWFNRQRLDIL